jgi:hypothetical protein
MDAYGRRSGFKAEFYDPINAKNIKSAGSDNFNLFPNGEGIIELGCDDAFYLYGGRTALVGALKEVTTEIAVVSTCADKAQLGVFFSTVGATGKTKQIVMITPADKSVVKAVGEEYLYKDPKAGAKYLYNSITYSTLAKLLPTLPK